MKKSIFRLSFLAAFLIFGCNDNNKDEELDISLPEISNVGRDISAPQPGETVIVSATVTASEKSPLASVVLKWTINGANPSEVSMSNGGGGDVYSGTISGQADGAEVSYMVVAANKNGSVDKSDSYIVTTAVIDYSKLRLNEVSGVGDDIDKFYELINIGAKDIPLAGVKIYYNANSGSTGGTFPPDDNRLTWEGDATQVIKAGALFALIGRNTQGSFTTGLTAQRILIITLEAPDGEVIDLCIRAEDSGVYNFTDKSFSRIPDGTGLFYFTVPTPNATNGISTDGLTLVPETRQEPEIPDYVDYTKLMLNEISGEHKYVEIYNSGDVDIPLTGVKLQRNDGQSQWTGGTADVIPAGAYRLFLFNSYKPADLAENPAYVGWTVGSGISDQQILKVAIVDPADNPVSVFIRGDAPLPAWQYSTDVTRDQTHSYSRMTDGTWAYADPTPGAENGAKASDIVAPGYLTAQP